MLDTNGCEAGNDEDSMKESSFDTRTLSCLSRLDSICIGLACYSISYHTLAVSPEAWHVIYALAVSHAILYLITPWQYQLRLGMLFFILEAQLASWTNRDMQECWKWEVPFEHAEEVLDFASGRVYSIGQRANLFAKKFLPKISQK